MDEFINYYDSEAEASCWFGPEVLFGLTYKYLQAGETLLDIGIGTGLSSALFKKAGLEITGMDLSREMLEICRKKQLSDNLIKHDLTVMPYPIDSDSTDHIICAGVMNFFQNLTPIFSESSRIIRSNGVFGFIVIDKKSDDTEEIHAGPEHTKSEQSITMYRHSAFNIKNLLDKFDFKLERSIEFPIYMGRSKEKRLQAIAYVSRKK